MKQAKRSRRQLIRRCTQQHPQQQCTAIQDVPEELIQYIQSLLPVEDAARTSVLSKSWLRAWSTNPTLRFYQPLKLKNKKYVKVINRTLRRYRRENIPIVTFELPFFVHKDHNLKTVSRAHNWVRRVASTSCLREIYLCIYLDSDQIASYKLPDELFSGEKLNTIRVKGINVGRMLHIGNDTVVKCANLRVLELYEVNICEEVLDTVLSTCNLLEKIDLSGLRLQTPIKVKNLRILHSLRIESITEKGGLEVFQVPNLRSFIFRGSPNLVISNSNILPSFNVDLLRSVTTLVLNDVWVMDDAVLNIIRSSFPFLLHLTLGMKSCKLKVLDITCLSLKRLIIQLPERNQIHIPIHAPKLLYFRYSGGDVPTLFINNNPQIIELELKFMYSIPDHYHSFVFNLWEAALINIPRSQVNVSIRNHFYYAPGKSFEHWRYRSDVVPSKVVDEVRRRIPFPAKNVVQQLSLETCANNSLNDATKAIYDSLIWVCHPNYVQVQVLLGSQYSTISNWKLVISSMLDMKTKKELKDVKIKHPLNHKWEALTSAWLNLDILNHQYVHSFPAGSSRMLTFKLTW